MNREEKSTAVADLQGQFQRATVALLASSQGLTVAKVQELRRAVKQAGGEYKVAKNTFVRLAIKDTSFGILDELLSGPNGVVFGYADPVAVTKVLVKFAEENDKLSIKGGALGAKLLARDEVEALAKLPSREALLSQLLRLIQTPATQLLRTMQEPGASLVRLLGQLRGRLEQ